MNLLRLKHLFRRLIRRSSNKRYDRKSKAATSWDKASIATMLGSIGTLAALLFSMYQNSVNEDRYRENERDNKREQRRVSKRDSIQVTTLVNSFIAQLSEFKRLRLKDSINIALYQKQLVNLNKSLDYQNQNNLDQRLSNRSDLLLKVKFETLKIYEGTERIAPTGYANDAANIIPMFYLKNVGKVPANNIAIRCCIILEDDWAGKKTYTILRNEKVTVFDKNIIPNDTLFFRGNIGVGGIKKIFSDPERDKIRSLHSDQRRDEYRKLSEHKSEKDRSDKLHELYPYRPYTYFIACQLTYKDKFSTEINSTFTLHEISFYAKRNPELQNIAPFEYVSLTTHPVNTQRFLELKPVLQKAKYNINEMWRSIQLNDPTSIINVF